MVEGFKNTEIGAIPNDWEVKEFGELTDKIIGGGTPSRSNPLFWGNEIPWVTVKDFATFKSTQTQEYITKEGLKNSASHLIPKGTLITSTRMALGKTVIYDVDVSINQDLKAIFPKATIDTNFFYYWFQFNSKFIEDLGSGSTVMGISLPDLRKIKVKLPTKAEQTAIATALSDADALISSLEKLIAKKKAIKQGAMQELLKPKEGWETKTLGEVGEIKMCRRIFNYETKPVGTIPFYKIGTFGKEADAYITQELYNNYRERFSFPKKGDILISAAGTIGRTLVYDGNPAYFQDSNIVWIDNDETLISNKFLFYIYQIVKYNTEGGTIQRLYNAIIRNTIFSCPNKTEQSRITEILSDMDNEILILVGKLEKQRLLKQGMMQSLLTGKIRLV